ncbi:hypothetical protein BJX61DRAFT_515483 [Aspergillus egyptiacus]|nr:hypothetical protein BJX61DRAFT_515483 [Aspergillus egyptiacus]
MTEQVSMRGYSALCCRIINSRVAAAASLRCQSSPCTLGSEVGDRKDPLVSPSFCQGGQDSNRQSHNGSKVPRQTRHNPCICPLMRRNSRVQLGRLQIIPVRGVTE